MVLLSGKPKSFLASLVTLASSAARGSHTIARPSPAGERGRVKHRQFGRHVAVKVSPAGAPTFDRLPPQTDLQTGHTVRTLTAQEALIALSAG
jgi:hypothetical protein